MEPPGHRCIFEYAGRVKKLLVGFALLILEGCEEKREIYSRFLTDERVAVECVDINRSASYAPTLGRILQGAGFDYREGCPVRIVMFKNFASCTSAKQPGASRGFMRLELSLQGKVFYQVQQEFSDERDETLLANLAGKMARELKTP